MTDNTTHPRSDPVTRFLAELNIGRGISADIYTADARLDATVPHWRFDVTGAAAVAAQLSGWYDAPTTIESVHRQPVPGGEIVELDLGWIEDGVPHAAHQVHVITVADGRICADTVFCGGRWSATLLAEMEEARAH
jgi:hypothetical protein